MSGFANLLKLHLWTLLYLLKGWRIASKKETLKKMIENKKLGLAKTFTDHRKTVQMVLFYLKHCYLKQSSPYALWGVFSAQPIKSTIIQFQDHFALIASVFYLQFFFPLTSLRHLPVFMTVEQDWGAEGLLLLIAEGRNHSFQIKILDKWPYKVKEIKEVWDWG